MAEISKILVKGIEYDIEDEQARMIINSQQEIIEEIQKAMPTFLLDGTTLTIITNT